jgi:hypothetical protein
MLHGEPSGMSLRACSACSGDYEDPERSALRNPAEEEDEDAANAGDVMKPVARKEFPVREK